VPRQGFSTQLECKKSTYQPSKGATECLVCPVGFECPSDAMKEAKICIGGQFRSLEL